jgi:hypothetical protein
LCDVLALLELDRTDRAARLEAEIELACGREVAAARDGRLDDAALSGDYACLGGPLAGGRADDEYRSDDRAGN